MLILEKLWQGEISPIERAVKENSEYHKTAQRTTELQHMLYKELSNEGRKLFEEYSDNEGELTDISTQDAFIKGVRFGAKFMLAIYGEYDTQLPQIKK